MDWFVLICSGFMESAWAIALVKSEGFSNAVPTVVFVVCLALSMAGLGYAAKALPIGVAYAVWTGIGVVATAYADGCQLLDGKTCAYTSP